MPIVAWCLAALAFLVLLGVGSVTIYPGGGATREASIRRIWDVQSERLPPLGSTDLTRFLFGASVAVFVVGSLAVLWLALTLEDDPARRDGPDGRGAATGGRSEPA